MSLEIYHSNTRDIPCFVRDAVDEDKEAGRGNSKSSEGRVIHVCTQHRMGSDIQESGYLAFCDPHYIRDTGECRVQIYLKDQLVVLLYVRELSCSSGEERYAWILCCRQSLLQEQVAGSAEADPFPYLAMSQGRAKRDYVQAIYEIKSLARASPTQSANRTYAQRQKPPSSQFMVARPKNSSSN